MKIDKKKRRIILVLSIVLGAIGGFAYWRFVGCSSGNCGITANWHTSTIFGSVFGYLIGDSFKLKSPEETNKAELD